MSQEDHNIDYQKNIQSILKNIHRIKVMLWAFDYDAAQIELMKLEDEYSDFLTIGLLAEESFFEARKDIKDNQFEEKLPDKLENRELKKYQREYLIELQNNQQIIKRLNNDSFKDSFRISPISRTIKQLRMKLNSTSTSYFYMQKIREDSLSKYFFSRILLADDHIEYRAYSLNRHPTREGRKIIERLEQEFGVIPAIKKVDYYDELPLPLQAKLFILGAMIKITVHDYEHFAVEIMFSNIDPDEKFKKVYDIITELIPPQKI